MNLQGKKELNPVLDDVLKKMGYKLNKTGEFYEKEVEVKIRGKLHKIILKAVKLPVDDGKFNYFTCEPDENKNHMYIGDIAISYEIINKRSKSSNFFFEKIFSGEWYNSTPCRLYNG